MIMKPEELQKLELSLMRHAFEIACRKVALPMACERTKTASAHARMAFVVQALVERGLTDTGLISDHAVSAIYKASRLE